jgi:cold shock protein
MGCFVYLLYCSCIGDTIEGYKKKTKIESRFCLYNNKNKIKNFMTGTIKNLNPRGFGFISQEGQAGDTFFHKSALTGVTFEELKEGDAVSFDMKPAEEGGKGPSAVNVSRA